MIRAFTTTSAALAIVTLAACTGEANEDGDRRVDDDPGVAAGTDGGSDEDPSGEPEAEMDAIVDVEVSRIDDQAIRVAFQTVDGADSYLINFDQRTGGVRVMPGLCDSRCHVRIGRTTAGEAETLSVSAVIGDTIGPRSSAVALPALQEHGDRVDTTASDEIAVTRVDQSGRLFVETEQAPGDADPDRWISDRIAELEDDPTVLGAGINMAPRIDSPSGTEGPDAEAAWQLGTLNISELIPGALGAGATVAVIDMSIDPAHPALVGANVTVDRIRPDSDRTMPHGTLVTSMIVGQPDGDVPGIAPDTRILAYDLPFDTNAAEVAEAIISAVRDGADVINLSLSFGCESTQPEDCPVDVLGPAIEFAEAADVVVVASAGNDGAGGDHCDQPSNLDNFPAMFPAVIAVGASTRAGERWECSSERDFTDILAPGDEVLGAWTSDDDVYTVASGTSLAAPLVAGLIAAILAEHPDISPAEIRAAIARSTDESGVLAPLVLMQQLGLREFVLASDVLPFTIELSFNEGHPVNTLSEGIHRIPHSNHVGTGPFNPRLASAQLSGYLIVDDSGSVSGSVKVSLPAGIGSRIHFSRGGTTFTQFTPGHIVECPVSASTGMPIFGFDWDVRGAVTGRVDDSGSGDRLTWDLSIVMDDELPRMSIARDTLDECPAALDAAEPPTDIAGNWNWGHPSYDSYDDVLDRRDRLVTAVEQLYGAIIDEGPYEITMTGRWPAGGTSIATIQTEGGVRAEFIIGR